MKTLTNNRLEVMKNNASKAAKMLKLLANSKRLLILCHLLKNERTVSELQDLIGLSQSALSQHLAKMRQDGFLSITKKGKYVYYHINKPEVEAILSTLYLIYCKD
ncbi:ArsR/SmtB family transcription factor [Fluoribacter gormanii]|uniref:Probable HTH-type transcriptional regulator ygaV n=1 Tax=Fluoribacter gormanii TaxID=464 RepID=A0A377GN27_9GAMM|nr:metalloregulator ArsR/SmtB family transcription factor [Fluoribacter gormanii]KTD04787.1 transcriptional regulator, ArsR family [Fluoribacter gormanii]SIR17181.1 transcriptional regulator, ArsR family [Fluoribacter gormanii]STO26210.1 Probable HTH-type transcriptional regulator ygaV [Fluoribacter gormanii]